MRILTVWLQVPHPQSSYSTHSTLPALDWPIAPLPMLAHRNSCCRAQADAAWRSAQPGLAKPPGAHPDGVTWHYSGTTEPRALLSIGRRRGIEWCGAARTARRAARSGDALRHVAQHGGIRELQFARGVPTLTPRVG